MIRDDHNLVPVLLAALVHLAIFAAMVVAIDFSRPKGPVTPLAIKATLVSEAALEPPPPPGPTPEEIRQREQELAHRKALEAEQERIREQQAAEKRRLAEQAEQRRKREAAERERQRIEAEEQRRREEAEKERQRQEAEKRRLEEVERQRRENERRRKEAEAARREQLLQQELSEEAERQAAMSSGEMDRYRFAIQRKIEQNWVRPASAAPGLECVINVRQVPGGEVISATIERCNGDAAVQRSIEAAVFKASPLPEPDNPVLFERNLRITFKPEQ
ncbi:MAG TPA: cell envelope integrity protein TolA [Woeseiaceae bacterium]|nr:cell envelope integrity protein TolA [Woeseiaceae bacterium]